MAPATACGWYPARAVERPFEDREAPGTQRRNLAVRALMTAD
jgi:hypothetical protein